MSKSLQVKQLFQIVALFVFVSSDLYAFDGNRKGFVLGLGAGAHAISIDFEYQGEKIADPTEEGGLATSFLIGGGFNEQFLLYYIREASWYNAAYSDGISVRDITYVVGLSGVGLTYYFSPLAKSFYLNVALGVGDISAPFESISPDTGGAAMLGVGYEFAAGASIEGKILTTQLESKDLDEFILYTMSPSLTFNYRWY